MTTQKTTQQTTQLATVSMTGRGIVDLDAGVVRATVGLVSRTGPADLARPTPCAGWTLGDLIGHMTVQHYGWTAAAAGHGADLSCWQPGPPAADPVREYAAAAGRVLEAFGDDGVLGREFALAELSPVLRFPAAQAIGFHFIDYLVHGWDVARSLGLAYQPEADVLAAALPVAQAVPDGELRKQGLVPFAPGRPVSAQVGLLDQIVAMLGRSPAWPELRPGRAVTVGPCARNRRMWSSSVPGWPGRLRRGPWLTADARWCCWRRSSPGTGAAARTAAPGSSGAPTPTRSTCG
jgi:uncharacterized protein (TIGR03086 family)